MYVCTQELYAISHFGARLYPRGCNLAPKLRTVPEYTKTQYEPVTSVRDQTCFYFKSTGQHQNSQKLLNETWTRQIILILSLHKFKVYSLVRIIFLSGFSVKEGIMPLYLLFFVLKLGPLYVLSQLAGYCRSRTFQG